MHYKYSTDKYYMNSILSVHAETSFRKQRFRHCEGGALYAFIDSCATWNHLLSLWHANSCLPRSCCHRRAALDKGDLLIHYYVMRNSTRYVVVESKAEQFSDPPLLVLASLIDGPKHGYAMIEEIERMSGARLGPGTLYGAITRLEQQRLIEPLAVEERRQPYRLTVTGRRALRTKLLAMRQIVLAGLRKLEAQ